MDNERRRRFLIERLEEQRHLLQKSIKDMTEKGDLAEAVRVAIAIRILVHERGNSKPLLKYLHKNYLELPILDRVPKKQEALPPGVQSVVVMEVPVGFQIKSEGTFLSADLPAEAYTPYPLGHWWHRAALILPGLGGFSRKEVVLGLADKEGGAHVDPNISQRYEELMKNKSLQVGIENQVSPLNLSRLMAGQAGIELLHCLDKNFPKK